MLKQGTTPNLSKETMSGASSANAVVKRCRQTLSSRTVLKRCRLTLLPNSSSAVVSLSCRRPGDLLLKNWYRRGGSPNSKVQNCNTSSEYVMGGCVRNCGGVIVRVLVFCLSNLCSGPVSRICLQKLSPGSSPRIFAFSSLISRASPSPLTSSLMLFHPPFRPRRLFRRSIYTSICTSTYHLPGRFTILIYHFDFSMRTA